MTTTTHHEETAMIHNPDTHDVLDQLAEAYITASTMIRVEHALNGSCADREDDFLHDLLHDTMREISRTILLYVDNVIDVPLIREYLDQSIVR
jgi:hypothetical protein